MIGDLIEDYRIEEKLWHSERGESWRALDTILGRQVVIKLWRDRLLKEPAVLKTSRAQAMRLSQLNHSNIIKVYDFFAHEGNYLIVTEYVESSNWVELMKARPTLYRSLKLFLQLLSGLEHAHKRGIIHGNLKPVNLLITSKDEVKITNFSIHNLLRRQHNDIYLAPEQRQGDQFDHRVDIFALGVLLHELVVGKRPGRYGKGVLQTRLPFGLPTALERAINCAIKYDPENRINSISEFRAIIESAIPLVAKNELPVIDKPKSVFPGAVANNHSWVNNFFGRSIKRLQFTTNRNAFIDFRKPMVLLSFILCLAIVASLAIVQINRALLAKYQIIKTETKPIRSDAVSSATNTSKKVKPPTDSQLRDKTPERINELIDKWQEPSMQSIKPQSTNPINSRPNRDRNNGQRQQHRSTKGDNIERGDQVSTNIKPISLNRRHRTEELTGAQSWRKRALLSAAWQGESDDLKDILRQGANINTRDHLGRTPLILAAQRGHDHLVKILIERGAWINARDAQGKTALMRAIAGGHDDTVDALLKRRRRR